MDADSIRQWGTVAGVLGIGATMVPWKQWLAKLKPAAKSQVVKPAFHSKPCDLTEIVVHLRHHLSCLPKDKRSLGLDACDRIDELLEQESAQELE